MTKVQSALEELAFLGYEHSVDGDDEVFVLDLDHGLEAHQRAEIRVSQLHNGTYEMSYSLSVKFGGKTQSAFRVEDEIKEEELLSAFDRLEEKVIESDRRQLGATL